MGEDEEDVPKSSEAIIADLLNDVKASEKPFSVDKIAGCDETDVSEKKKRKHHKSRHKSKKSKKDRRRSRSRSDSSRSRNRSRSRSRERKKSSRRSRSRSRNRHSAKKNSKREESAKKSDELVSSLIAETTKPAAEPIAETAETSEPVIVPEFRPFRPREDEHEAPLESGDFPTSIVKKETKMEISITTVLPEVTEKKEDVEDGEIEDIAYDFETNSRETNEKEEKKTDDTKEKKEKDEKKKDGENSKKKDKVKEKSDRKRKSSPEKEKKRRSSADRPSSTRHRSRSKERPTRWRSRSPVPLRRRSRSPPVPRGRGEIRINRRSTSRDRRDWDVKRRRSRSRDRKDYDSYKRQRSRSREFIDKEKLLKIAQTKRAEMMSNGDRENASIDDFVVYCKKLQKRQEREKRREAGQAVSDHESDDETPKYKHPYALPKEPIRINIITATSANLAQKAIMAAEEPTQLNASQLRIVFPVSSGAVHKENAEWIPVEKNDVPKSCTTEQKKHIALTSLEIDRCRQQGIPIAPVAIPKFLDSILPPPPPPPQFLPNLNDPYRPPTPPSLPSVLYVPQKEKMIIKEPKDISIPAPNDISATLKQRTLAQKKLYSTPNDFEAHRELREANEKIELWAALKSLPGEYTGTTGLKLLTADELQPHNPKYHAWVKRDQFKNAAPATGGIGKQMMERMGWRPGEGLGKDASGNVEPLVLDVKSDRRGLQAEEEMSIKQRNKLNAQNNVPVDLSSKNPVSLLMELCAKRRWPNPVFSCEDSGQDHMKMFVWTVNINNVAYRPMCGSKQKKEGKAVAAQVALQSLGVLPRDPDLPVFI